MTLLLKLIVLCSYEGPHDVRVRMKAVGICGSDVHYLKVLTYYNIIRENLDLLWFLILEIVLLMLQKKKKQDHEMCGFHCERTDGDGT